MDITKTQKKAKELKGEIQPLQEKVESIEVTNKKEKEEAEDMLLKVKKKIKKMEKAKDEYVGPFWKATRKLNKQFLDPIKKTKSLEGKLKRAIIRYEDKIEEEAKKAEEEAQKKAKDGDVVDVPDIDVPEKTVEREEGKITTIEKTDWKVENFKDIPDEYKKVDTKKVGKAVRKGKKIPGIKEFKRKIKQVRA